MDDLFPRVIVTGSSGCLGRRVVRYFKSREGQQRLVAALLIGSASSFSSSSSRPATTVEVDIVGADRTPSETTTHLGDITDRCFVNALFGDPSSVTHDGFDGAVRGSGASAERERRPRVIAVVHAASLHKPHVATHSRQAFIDVNITGTLNLLEATVSCRNATAAVVVNDLREHGKPRSVVFIFISTTSIYGDALSPPKDQPAVWIDESVVPIPKNIYGEIGRAHV